MASLLILLSLVASLVSIVCWIMVLIKLFGNKGIGWGIFGILCAIYTFIWGWQNVGRFDIQKVMLIWSIAFGANIILPAVLQTVGS